jgi:hypothetical protein
MAGLTQEDFASKVEKALGKPVTFDARPVLHQLKTLKLTKVSLRYEWIKDPRFYSWVYTSKEVDMGDGAEWITVWMRAES